MSRTFTVNVTNGLINIRFVSIRDNPQVCLCCRHRPHARGPDRCPAPPAPQINGILVVPVTAKRAAALAAASAAAIGSGTGTATGAAAGWPLVLAGGAALLGAALALRRACAVRAEDLSLPRIAPSAGRTHEWTQRSN